MRAARRLRQHRRRAAAEGAVRGRDARRLRPLRSRRLVRGGRPARLSRRGRARSAALPAPAGRAWRAAIIWRSTRRRAKAWSWSARRRRARRQPARRGRPHRHRRRRAAARRRSRRAACSIARGSRRGSIWSPGSPTMAGCARRCAAALRALPDIGRALGRLVAGRGGPRDLGQLRDGLDEARRAARPARPARADPPALLAESLRPRWPAMARWSICSTARWCRRRRSTPRRAAISPKAMTPRSTRCARPAARGGGRSPRWRRATGPQTGIADAQDPPQQRARLSYRGAGAERRPADGGRFAASPIARRWPASSASTRPICTSRRSRVGQAGAHALAAEAAHLEELTAGRAGPRRADRRDRRRARPARRRRGARRAGGRGRLGPAASSTEAACFEVEGGRHPVVEAALRAGRRALRRQRSAAVGEQSRLWLVTGPNMGGKSTFLRQNALIAVLAQAGSLRPRRTREARPGRPAVQPRRRVGQSRPRPLDLHGRDGRDRRDPRPGDAAQLRHPRRGRPRHLDL